MDTGGWIKIHRRIMDTDDWLSEPFTRAQAWVDLLLLANHKTGHIRKRGIMITVERGQVGYSEQALAARWKWSRGKIIRFLSGLVRDLQISRNPVQQNPHLSSLITVINYDLYQSNGTTDGTTDGTTERRQKDDKRYRNKNDKNDKNEKKENTKTVHCHAPFACPDWIDPKVWTAFQEMRTKMRKPMTTRAKELLVMKLTSMRTKGHDANTLLDTAIECGWLTVYEPRQDVESANADVFAQFRAAHANDDEEETEDLP